jgi:iron(III) transport system ATP-binding protein
LSLSVSAGEILAIAGKSGSGKTTLLKCIFGLVDCTAGEITINSDKVLGPSWQLIPGHVDMSLVSQDYYVLDNHTVAENISDKLIGYTDDYKQKRVKALLQLLELTALKNMRAKMLSSGQKQRVAIARALAEIPKLLLLDEPFSNLDHLLTVKLFSFIMKEAKKNNSAVILITHQGEEALKYANRIAIIDNGKLQQIGNTWDVYYKPSNQRLAGLLGEYTILQSDDFLPGISKKIAKKQIVRPDKIAITTSTLAQLQLTAENCSFNGKCYEVLLSSASGKSVLLYSAKELSVGKTYFCKIAD